MGSAILFHGPGAEKAAHEATTEGRLLAPPFGKDGLKVDEVREAISLLGTTPVGDELGVVLVGPVDLANEFAADVLLKTLEDHDERYVRPILWAYDLGNVSPTIQSRCTAQWSPSSEKASSALKTKAYEIINAVREDNHSDMITAVQECKGEEYELLVALADCLQETPNQETVEIWSSLRQVVRYHAPKPLEIISALLVG